MLRRLMIASLAVLLMAATSLVAVVRAQGMAGEVRILESTPAACPYRPQEQRLLRTASSRRGCSLWPWASTSVTRPRVEWAQSFRVKPREDVFVVDRTAAAPLDPYTDGGCSSSVGIDATRPYGVDFRRSRKSPDGATSTCRLTS
jgi:hypothetical protein